MSQEHLPSTTLAQLDRLLPLDLAAAIQTQHPPPPEALARALALLRARLDAILPLVPPPIAHQHLRDPSPGAILCQRLYGSLLFADLSGFTALSEQLAALGREGSEVVTEVINRLFAALTGEVHRYGGALLKFGGDALTALFDQAELGEDHAALALAAAQGMQQQMAAIGLVETRGGRHQLRLRTGVHSGTLIAAQLGDNEHMELLLTGHAVHQVARAQEVALPGEVVLSTAALAHIAGAQVTPRDEDFAVLLAFDPPAPRAAPRLPLPKQSGDLAEISALVEAISALELFLPQGLAHTGIVADERLASGFRLVTVLFAHVAPLSTLLEQLPPDLDAALLLNAYYRRMQQVVQRFGGSINKLDLAADGDKLLACFGAPLAQEQHHELAVRAALAMQAALAEANAEIAALGLDLPPLQQRLGLNTGHVFAGLVGTPARREYTVMGDVVNLAARLMAYAPPGAIWISPVTQRAVAHCIQCQALPALQLKGKAAPVTPYAVITAYEAERPRETGLVGRAPLVGRQAELALLQEAATTALQGAGRTVVLIGEAGVGKSRMIEELLSWLSLQSLTGGSVPVFTLLTTECQSYEQAVAFSSLRDLLQQLLRLPGSTQINSEQIVEQIRRQVEALVPELERFTPLLGEVLGLPIPETTVTASLKPEQRRDRIHDLVVGLLGAAARQQPLVVVWDDLHWCDASSLDVVHALNDRASHYPLLLLLGLRPDPLLLKSLGDHVMALRIGELEARAGAELVATLLKGAPPPALLERLRTSDEGYNPFFVEELLRALIETGALVQRNGGWELAGDVATLEIPDTIEEVIAARIDRLEARQRETLQTASVIGRRFYYPILAGVANEQRQLQQRLMALASAELLLPEDEQSYLFKHMLTRDAVYASILYARRRELHRRVARRIEEVYGDRLEEQLPLLARHYYAAEDWSPALRYSMAAGRRAQERYHNREALTLFEMALGALSHLEPQQTIEAEAYERMGLALFHMADYEEAWTALERALEILKTAAPDDHEGQARIYRHLAVVAERRADYDLALSLVEQGLRLIEHSDSAEIAALLLVSVGPYQRQGRYAEALVSVEHGLEVARQHNKLRDMAYAYQLLCGIYWRLGQNRQGIEAAKKSLALYTELNDLSGQADAQMNLANILTEVGLFMEAVWDATQLRDAWMQGKLNGIADALDVRFFSINGHFEHWRTIAADLTTDLTATLVFDEPRAPGAASLFDHALLFSVGCHSGFSVGDTRVTSDTYAVDWAQAILRQGGNWVANTGFGYGDSDLIGYSERLMLNYTQELGRKWLFEEGNPDSYGGMPIGEALVRAKRRYVMQAPPGSFGVYDEKVLAQATLYGLPYLRAKVVNPRPFPREDPQRGSPSLSTLSTMRTMAPLTLTSTPGVATRVLTLTLEPVTSSARTGRIPWLKSAVVEDSAGIISGTLSASLFSGAGRPALPQLSISLDPGELQIRAVTLRGANVVTYDAFDPAVTRLISDEIYLEEEPEWDIDSWYPDQPFAFSTFATANVTGTDIITRGQLAIVPFQYYGADGKGTLRAFTRMVFEITYLDPSQASADVILDQILPEIVEVTQSISGSDTIVQIEAVDGVPVGTATELRPVHELTVLIGVDNGNGVEWQALPMTQESDYIWKGVASGLKPYTFTMFVAARDAAGNEAVHTQKGQLFEGVWIWLPVIQR